MSPGLSFVGARENGNTIARWDRQNNAQEILALCERYREPSLIILSSYVPPIFFGCSFIAMKAELVIEER